MVSWEFTHSSSPTISWSTPSYYVSGNLNGSHPISNPSPVDLLTYCSCDRKELIMISTMNAQKDQAHLLLSQAKPNDEKDPSTTNTCSSLFECVNLWPNTIRSLFLFISYAFCPIFNLLLSTGGYNHVSSYIICPSSEETNTRRILPL